MEQRMFVKAVPIFRKHEEERRLYPPQQMSQKDWVVLVGERTRLIYKGAWHDVVSVRASILCDEECYVLLDDGFESIFR